MATTAHSAPTDITAKMLELWETSGFVNVDDSVSVRRLFWQWVKGLIDYLVNDHTDLTPDAPGVAQTVMRILEEHADALPRLVWLFCEPSQLEGLDLLKYLEPWIYKEASELHALPAVPGLAARRSTSTPLPSPPATPHSVADAGVHDAPTPSGVTPGVTPGPRHLTSPVTPGAPGPRAPRRNDHDHEDDDDDEDDDDEDEDDDDDEDDDRAVGATPATSRRRAGSDDGLVPTTPGRPGKLGKPVKRERSRSRDGGGGGGGGGGASAWQERRWELEDEFNNVLPAEMRRYFTVVINENVVPQYPR